MATNKTVPSVALRRRVTASAADPHAGHSPLENRDGRRTIRTEPRPVKRNFVDGIFPPFALIRRREKVANAPIKSTAKTRRARRETEKYFESPSLLSCPSSLRGFAVSLIFVSPVTFAGGVNHLAARRSAAVPKSAPCSEFGARSVYNLRLTHAAKSYR